MGRDSPVQQSTVEFRDRLEVSRDALMDAIAGLDEEGFRARPGASEWTAAEALAHLLRMEAVLMQRTQAALAEEGFVVTPVSPDERLEQVKLAQRMPVPQLLHGLLAQRRDTLRLLDGLSQTQLTKTFHHPRWGERTITWLFQHTAEHEEEHAAQIRALRVQKAATTP